MRKGFDNFNKTASLPSEVPDPIRGLKATHILSGHYPSTVSMGERLETIEDVFEYMKKTVVNPSVMNMSAGVGLPYRENYTDLRTLLEEDGPDAICMAAAARYCRIRAVSPDIIMEMDTNDLIHYGLNAPYVAFSKTELTNKKKIDAGRARVIFGVSITWTLVEKAITSDQFEAEKSNYMDGRQPSKNGLGADEFGLQVIKDNFEWLKTEAKKYGFHLSTDDVSGYDSCIKFWSFLFEGVRLSLCTGEKSLNNMVFKLLMLESLCQAFTVNRELFEQTIRGMMKSGANITSQCESGMRALKTVLVNGLVCAAVCGDDAGETTKFDAESLIAQYAKLGIVMKAVQEEDLIFCGYYRDRGVPERPMKMFANFLQSVGDGKENEKIFSLAFELRHSPMRREILQYCAKVMERRELDYRKAYQLEELAPEVIDLMAEFLA